MQGYLDTQNSVSSIGTSYFEFACFGSGEVSQKNGFVAETVAYIVLPMLFILFTALGSLLHVYFKNNRVLDENVVRTAKASAMGVASISLFLLQPTLVKQFALLFSCTRMGSRNQDMFMVENLRIQCYSGEHIALIFGLGVPLLGFYVFGIPAAMYVLLSHPESKEMIRAITEADEKGRTATLDDRASIQRAYLAHSELDQKTKAFEQSYAFLFLGYKPELYLWEIAVLARKGALSVIGVAFSTNPRTQVMLGMFLIFASTVAHARFMPFNSSLMNNYEFISLAASSLTFFIGVFTMDTNNGEDIDAEDSPAQKLASALAFFTNMVYVFVAIPIGYKVKMMSKNSKEIHKVRTAPK